MPFVNDREERQTLTFKKKKTEMQQLVADFKSFTKQISGHNMIELLPLLHSSGFYDSLLLSLLTVSNVMQLMTPYLRSG